MSSINNHSSNIAAPLAATKLKESMKLFILLWCSLMKLQKAVYNTSNKTPQRSYSWTFTKVAQDDIEAGNVDCDKAEPRITFQNTKLKAGGKRFLLYKSYFGLTQKSQNRILILHSTELNYIDHV